MNRNYPHRSQESPNEVMIIFPNTNIWPVLLQIFFTFFKNQWDFTSLPITISNDYYFDNLREVYMIFVMKLLTFFPSLNDMLIHTTHYVVVCGDGKPLNLDELFDNWSNPVSIQAEQVCDIVKGISLLITHCDVIFIINLATRGYCVCVYVSMYMCLRDGWLWLIALYEEFVAHSPLINGV